ncbi:MAG: hypothetical protein LBG20_02585 [Holosporaceae bacterium]|nr:hypothetical protein [Holosporaceae bacterium]
MAESISRGANRTTSGCTRYIKIWAQNMDDAPAEEDGISQKSNSRRVYWRRILADETECTPCYSTII